MGFVRSSNSTFSSVTALEVGLNVAYTDEAAAYGTVSTFCKMSMHLHRTWKNAESAETTKSHKLGCSITELVDAAFSHNKPFL